ncbi:hypothetical protein BJX99DRAFT_234092 [Aspergillus californicus]
MDGRGPYGLACMNCFKAKSKCIGRPDGDGCQRCHRLKKQCSPSDSIRRRNSQKAQSSRIAELEAKLDGLFTFLQSTQSAQSPTAASQAGPQRSPLGATPMSQSSYMPVAYNSPLGETRNAEEALVLFRDRMLPYFPIMHLPPTVSAQHLREERPFLLQVILAVTARTFQEKKARAHSLKMTVAHEMIVENRSNVDLLLGLLTYAAWGYDQLVQGEPTTSRLTELAVSLVNSLHLNKPLHPDSRMMTLLGGNVSRTAQEDVGCRTMEERRAVLGCFMLSSVVSAYFSQMDPMPWTSQMDEFLGFVEANPEHPHDLALASLVRLQLLVCRALEAREGNNGQVPIRFFLQTFQSQLHALHLSIPPELQNRDTILAQFYAVKLRIHTLAFIPETAVESPGGTSLPAEALSWEQVNCMQGALQAIRSWVEIYYRIPPQDFPCFTLITWAQLGRSLVSIFRLATVVDVAWDREIVWRTVNLFDIIKRTAQCLHEVSGAKEDEESDDFWWHVGRLGRTIRAWMEPHVKDESSEETTPTWEQQVPIAPEPLAAPYTDEPFGWDGSSEALLRTLQLGNSAWPDRLANEWSPDFNMGMPP